MDKLPEEIISTVQSYCPNDWLYLCNKSRFQEHSDTYPMKRLLIHWISLRSKQDQTRKRMRQKRVEISEKSRAFRYDIFTQIADEHEITRLGVIVSSYKKESVKVSRQLSPLYSLSRLEKFYDQKIKNI